MQYIHVLPSGMTLTKYKEKPELNRQLFFLRSSFEFWWEVYSLYRIIY